MIAFDRWFAQSFPPSHPDVYDKNDIWYAFLAGQALVSDPAWQEILEKYGICMRCNNSGEIRYPDLAERCQCIQRGLRHENTT